jgi:hypothetical protein
MAYAIRYELDLAGVPDVSHTYEQFGRSVLVEPFAKSHFAQPLLIVWRQVYERLIGLGAKAIAARSLDIVNVAGPWTGLLARIQNELSLDSAGRDFKSAAPCQSEIQNTDCLKATLDRDHRGGHR